MFFLRYFVISKNNLVFMKKFLIVSLLILTSFISYPSYASHIEIDPCIEVSHCAREELDVKNINQPFEKIKLVVQKIPRTEIVDENGDYLHAEVTSRIMKYVDDLELSYIENENKIIVRSESRVGEGDFGVNKKRVERLKNNFFE